MKAIILLMCVPFLSGMANTAIDHQTIDFIKKNEGYSEIPYLDGKSLSVCYGNKFDGKNRIENRKYTKSECEKLIYNHYFKNIKSSMPKDLSLGKWISISDARYQFGHNAKITEKHIKSYPQRGRWKLYKEEKNEISGIY